MRWTNFNKQWKFIQTDIRYFKSLPIATYYKNIYLQPKIFNMGLKWNSYLTSLLRCGPVNSSTPIFGNISLTETMAIYLLLGNLINKWLQESLISLSSLYNYLQTKFISDVNFPSVSGKSVNPYFPHDQFHKNNDKFTCSLKNH